MRRPSFVGLSAIGLSAIVLLGLLLLVRYSPTLPTTEEVAAAHLDKGLDYFTAGQFDEALTELTKAIELSSETSFIVEVLSLRAATHIQRGDFDQALKDLDASIDLKPTVAITYLGRGNIYLDLERWEDAILDFDKAIELNDHLYQAYLSRGTAHFGLDQLDLALTDYRASVALAPDQPDVDQLYETIKTLEEWKRGQSESAWTTPSALCAWFVDSQLLRNARVAELTKFISFHQQYGIEGFASVEPSVRSELLTAIEEYISHGREFLTAWQQFGSIPSAETAWNNELIAEQQKLAAMEKMVVGLKTGDNDLYITAVADFAQAMIISREADASLLEVEEGCLD